MNKIILFTFCFFVSNLIFCQSLPGNRYFGTNYILDEISQNPSYAYSMRKLKKTYTGYAVKVRRSSDNAEANVDFDSNDVVSATSNVIVTAVGTSGLTLGQTLNYNTFKGVSTLFVTTWYDQGTNGYNATQTNGTLQPTLVLNSASPSNLLPSIEYDGASPPDFLTINQPIENLTTNGINGTFMLVVKPTRNLNQLSFGMQASSNWRWSFHMNWGDGFCYFDASETCCASNRRFHNSASINSYQQYSFIRGTTYKTVKQNNIFTTLNNSSAASTPQTGGTFSLGTWSGNTGTTGFFGNTSEIIMFPTDLTNLQITPLISNQMFYWGL